MTIPVGVFLIVAGLAWMGVMYIGGAMADVRGDQFWENAGKPMLPGLAAVVVGVLLIWFR